MRWSSLAGACVALGVAWPDAARAQGCVVARQSPGRAADGALAPDQWQLSLGARWLRASRHFVGTRDQTDKIAPGAGTVNEITTAELEVARGLSDRVWWLVTVPTFLGERSEPLSSGDGAVVGRARSSARGLGDVTLGARAWLWSPAGRPRGNVALGASLKLPTGDPGATAAVATAGGGVEVRAVDASIQPGDGGLGVLLAAQATHALGRGAAFAQASYLVSPRETNGVPTSRPRPSEARLSVPDAYLVRAGASWPLWRGAGGGLAARVEGTPVHDLVGGSAGFRRPGYSASLEPFLAVDDGSGWGASLAVPIAIARNRQASVAERADGVRGDATFADYSVILTVTKRFDASSPAMAHPMATSGGTRVGDAPVALPSGTVVPPLGERLTVVNAWATWCHACRDELPVLEALHRRFAPRGVAIIGVSLDEEASRVAPYLRGLGVGFPSLWGGPDALAEPGEALVPTTWILDARGAVVHRVRGAVSAGELDAKLLELLGGAR